VPRAADGDGFVFRLIWCFFRAAYDTIETFVGYSDRNKRAIVRYNFVSLGPIPLASRPGHLYRRCYSTNRRQQLPVQLRVRRAVRKYRKRPFIRATEAIVARLRPLTARFLAN